MTDKIEAAAKELLYTGEACSGILMLSHVQNYHINAKVMRCSAAVLVRDRSGAVHGNGENLFEAIKDAISETISRVS